jgi:hypothetical protein
MEMPLNMDFWIVNPDTLPQHAARRTPSQGFDQAVALQDPFLKQLVRTLLGIGGAVQDESGKHVKRLRRCLREEEQRVEI